VAAVQVNRTIRVYPPRRPTKLQADLERKHAPLSARSLTAAEESSRSAATTRLMSRTGRTTTWPRTALVDAGKQFRRSTVTCTYQHSEPALETACRRPECRCRPSWRVRELSLMLTGPPPTVHGARVILSCDLSTRQPIHDNPKSETRDKTASLFSLRGRILGQSGSVRPAGRA